MQNIIMLTVLSVLGLGAGISAVLQQVLNTRLTSDIGSTALTVCMSYIVGLVLTVVYIAVCPAELTHLSGFSRAPWWSWTGGLFGVAFVFLAVVLTPRLGATTFVSLVIAGQLIASLCIDHFGLFGMNTRAIDLARVVGIGMLSCAIGLIALL